MVCRIPRFFWPVLFVLIPILPEAEPLYSPTWGFSIDPPAGYEYVQGNGRDRFSFRSTGGAALDLVVYGPGAGSSYPSLEALTGDMQNRLGNRGDRSGFTYRGKGAALMELAFTASPDRNGPGAPLSGWGLCVELEPVGEGAAVFLAALAYGPAGAEDLQIFHLSALDSIAPTGADRLAPGPVTEFSYPRTKPVRTALGNSGFYATLDETDAEAAQALVDREFALLRRQSAGPLWQDAWKRFYRTIHRDSFDRLAEAAFILERGWREDEPRRFAERVLGWIQSFRYERDRMGSDFVNLVSAMVEGRGDCDSRAMLWAIILEQAAIPVAIMVSREYNHAMGLADLEGEGARFEMDGVSYLVAETTAPVALGLIDRESAGSAHWMGISF
jgi:hypothetical protein